MDNQWLGTPRQRLGILASPLYLWPCFDAAFVAGERQSKFASRLGFGERRSQTGGVVGDTRKFAGEPSSSGFLFVGRLVHQKAPDILGEAYAAYRANREDPWPLRVCGVGPDARILAEVAGVEMMGFVQPSELPAVMAMCACLVLPSRFEPFGVVVHEAVAMGLHVIASTAVGAADLFVDDEVNGRIVLAGDAFDLAKALDWMHDRTDEARLTGIQRSHDLSLRRSPQMWSAALLSLYARFDPDRRSYGRARLLR
jgi:glycosyltransferase involved in cell wall biosynthesis